MNSKSTAKFINIAAFLLLSMHKTSAETIFGQWSLTVEPQIILLATNIPLTNNRGFAFACTGNGLNVTLMPAKQNETEIYVSCVQEDRETLRASNIKAQSPIQNMPNKLQSILVSSRENDQFNSHKILNIIKNNLIPNNQCRISTNGWAGQEMPTQEFKTASAAFLAACEARGQIQ